MNTAGYTRQSPATFPWTASGIRVEYEWAEHEHGQTDATVTDCFNGGTYTIDADSDTEVSARANAVGCDVAATSTIRCTVYAFNDATGRYTDALLFEMYPDSRSLQRLRGGNDGTIDLYGIFAKYATDLRGNDAFIPADTKITGTNGTGPEWAGQSYFKWVADSSVDGSAATSAYMTSRAADSFFEDHVWEFGGSVLDELKYCAQAIGGELRMTPDGTQARIEAAGYPSPETMDAWELAPDDFLEGVTVQEPEIVNRVIAKYSNGDINRYVDVRLDDRELDHPWKYANIGYWAVKQYDFGTLDLRMVDAGCAALEEGNVAFNLIAEWVGDTAVFRLKSAATGMYLDVKDAIYEDGTPVRWHAGNDSDAQKWERVWINGESYMRCVGDEDYWLTRVPYQGGWGLAIYQDTHDETQAFRFDDRDLPTGLTAMQCTGTSLWVMAQDTVGELLTEYAEGALSEAADNPMSTFTFSCLADAYRLKPHGYVTAEYDDGGTSLEFSGWIRKASLTLDRRLIANVEVIGHAE